MLVSYSIQLHARCHACLTMVPVNGACAATACYVCGKTVDLGDAFWRARFDPDSGFEPFLVPDGRTKSDNERDSHLVYGKQMPACNVCSAALDAAALAAALEARSLACPSCGRDVRVRTPDERVRHIDRHATMVVDETHRDREALAEPIVFACKQCSAPLSVDGRARTIDCTYCRASNYLPDELWLVVYPVESARPFYVVCEYDEMTTWTMRWVDCEVQLADAARADLPRDVFARLASDDDYGVREVVAANAAAPPDVLVALARDGKEDVRCAAAGNTALPDDAVVKLAQTDGDAAGALVARSAMPAEAADALARAEDASIRRRVAAHPSLPLVTLRALASDRDEDVASVAKKRIRELRAQGIEVPGGGLFSKLFGG